MKAHTSYWLLLPAIFVCAFAVSVPYASAATYGNLTSTTTTNGLSTATQIWGQELGNGVFANGQSLTGISIRADYGIGYTAYAQVTEFDASQNVTEDIQFAASTTATGFISFQNITYGTLTFDANKCYRVRIYANGNSQTPMKLYGSSQDIWNNSTAGCAVNVNSNNNSFGFDSSFNPTPIKDYYFQLYTNGTSVIDWGAVTLESPIDFKSLIIVATSTSLFQNNQTDLQSVTKNCDDNGNFFSRGICYAGSYLFIPNPQILDDYVALPAVLETKFPFSWVFGVKTALANLSATSGNSPVYTIQLRNLGIGSSSPMGNLLPNITAFSSTTVLSYISASTWAAGQTLMGAALWLALGMDIFYTVRRRHSHG